MRLDRRTEVKVPQIIALFWVVKVLTTALGESVSDYSVYRFNPVLAVCCGFVVFVVSLLVQLAARRYLAWVYWVCVAMVAIFGTMAADVLHVRFKVPYTTSTLLFAVVLVVVFVAWDRVERTLSIHSIVSLRRELFYWAAVLVTFALGTAAGDLTAKTVGLGYLGSGFLFLGLIAIPAVAWRWFGLNSVLAFWSAYVVTRPLGASFADWLGKPPSLGGLGLGDGIVGALFATAFVALVAYLAVSKADARAPAARDAADAAERA